MDGSRRDGSGGGSLRSSLGGAAHPSDPDNLLVFDVVVGTRGNNPSLLSGAIHLVSLESRK